jgi:hypothetical protein
MTSVLSFLLSRIFDEALAPEHRADLERSTISAETTRSQCIRSVPPSLISSLLGFDLPGFRSALLFPFRSVHKGFMDHARVKLFPALTDRDGHTVKYLQPKGSSPRLYFVASTLAAVTDTSPTLWICEGEKKTCAMAQLGMAAVGICGVEGWHHSGECTLLPDFDAIPLYGRDVRLVPDGDAATNPGVAIAVQRLGYALRGRGARPRLVVLPERVS